MPRGDSILVSGKRFLSTIPRPRAAASDYAISEKTWLPLIPAERWRSLNHSFGLITLMRRVTCGCALASREPLTMTDLANGR